ncbi:hypothetical protein LEMLEM_LOCUS1314 [Lemmus lemmus]
MYALPIFVHDFGTTCTDTGQPDLSILVQGLTCTDTGQPDLSILAPDAVQEVLALPGSCPTEHKSFDSGGDFELHMNIVARMGTWCTAIANQLNKQR